MTKSTCFRVGTRGTAIKDMSGERFGRLQILWPAGYRGVKGRSICYAAQCDCGRVTVVTRCNLRDYNTVSCGCLNRELCVALGKASVKHGNARPGRLTAEYHSWREAKKRCFNKRRSQYADYGGRGITMCDRWRDSFENFLEDMGERPPGTSLDRWPNNDGNYEPSNCRWATRKQQSNNRRPWGSSKTQLVSIADLPPKKRHHLEGLISVVRKEVICLEL